MKDFLLIFRSEVLPTRTGTPEEMQAAMQGWIDWIGGIAQKGHLTDRGNRLADSGKVVRSGSVITDGPYSDIKEFIGGYTIVKADSIENATALVNGCPILKVGGSVEVREIDVIS